MISQAIRRQAGMMILMVVAMLAFQLIFCTPFASAAKPFYALTLDVGTTNNLYADSLEQQDTFGALALGLEHKLSSSIVLYYNGFAEAYSKTSDLKNLQNTAGAQWGRFLGDRAETWVDLGISNVNYAGEYDLYDQLNGYFYATVRCVASEFVRLRLAGEYSLSTYPHADELDVDYSGYNVSSGVNLAMIPRLALDVELGLQNRSYSEIDNTPSTSFGWVNIRASGPLSPSWGWSVLGTVREQLVVAEDDIFALYLGGLDAGSLLWDGWSLQGSITHLWGLWRMKVTASREIANYVESLAGIGVSAREDERYQFTFAINRSIMLGEDAPTLSFGLNATMINNQSNDSYYEYNGGTVSIDATLTGL